MTGCIDSTCMRAGVPNAFMINIHRFFMLKMLVFFYSFLFFKTLTSFLGFSRAYLIYQVQRRQQSMQTEAWLSIQTGFLVSALYFDLGRYPHSCITILGMLLYASSSFMSRSSQSSQMLISLCRYVRLNFSSSTGQHMLLLDLNPRTACFISRPYSLGEAVPHMLQADTASLISGRLRCVLGWENRVSATCPGRDLRRELQNYSSVMAMRMILWLERVMNRRILVMDREPLLASATWRWTQLHASASCFLNPLAVIGRVLVLRVSMEERCILSACLTRMLLRRWILLCLEMATKEGCQSTSMRLRLDSSGQGNAWMMSQGSLGRFLSSCLSPSLSQQSRIMFSIQSLQDESSSSTIWERQVLVVMPVLSFITSSISLKVSLFRPIRWKQPGYSLRQNDTGVLHFMKYVSRIISPEKGVSQVFRAR